MGARGTLDSDAEVGAGNASFEGAPLIDHPGLAPAPAARRRWWHLCCRPRGGGTPRKKIPKWVVNNVLLFSFMWQCLVVVLYRLAFDKAFSSTGVKFDLGVIIMVLMQIVQLVFIVIISVKLSKQVLHHTVTNWFLVQTYLATILLFTGLYTVIERAAAGSFAGLLKNGELNHDVITIRFLYFSTQTMTTVGYGDIVSNAWYCDLLVVVQMLLSVLYTTVIFSKGLAFFSLEPPRPRKKKHPLPAVQPIDIQ